MRLDKLPKPEDCDDWDGGEEWWEGKEEWLEADKKRKEDLALNPWSTERSGEEWWKGEYKRRDEQGKRLGAETKAWVEVEFAKEVLQAAQSDNFGEAVESATLIGRLQDKIASIKTRLEKLRKKEEKVNLRGNLLGSQIIVDEAKEEVKQHKKLLDWIE